MTNIKNIINELIQENNKLINNNTPNNKPNNDFSYIS